MPSRLHSLPARFRPLRLRFWAVEEAPKALLEQLAPGGRLVLCLNGSLCAIDREARPRTAVTETAARNRAAAPSSGFDVRRIYEGAGFTPLHFMQGDQQSGVSGALAHRLAE